MPRRLHSSLIRKFVLVFQDVYCNDSDRANEEKLVVLTSERGIIIVLIWTKLTTGRPKL